MTTSSRAYAALQRLRSGGWNSTKLAQALIDQGQTTGHSSLMSVASRVRACLDSKKSVTFSMSELTCLMDATGQYAPLHFICDSLGLTRPEVKDSDQVRGHLSARRDSIAAELSALDDEMASLPASDFTQPKLTLVGSRFDRGSES